MDVAAFDGTDLAIRQVGRHVDAAGDARVLQELLCFLAEEGSQALDGGLRRTHRPDHRIDLPGEPPRRVEDGIELFGRGGSVAKVVACQVAGQRDLREARAELVMQILRDPRTFHLDSVGFFHAGQFQLETMPRVIPPAGEECGTNAGATRRPEPRPPPERRREHDRGRPFDPGWDALGGGRGQAETAAAGGHAAVAGLKAMAAADRKDLPPRDLQRLPGLDRQRRRPLRSPAGEALSVGVDKSHRGTTVDLLDDCPAAIAAELFPGRH